MNAPIDVLHPEAVADPVARTVLLAAIAYAEAAGRDAPDVDGIAARVWARAQLMTASDRYARALRVQRSEGRP